MTNPACSNSTAFSSPWDAVTGWSSAMMSAVDCVQGCASACAGWQQETARFLDVRLAENQRTWAALLSSRDLACVMKVQQEWGLQAATDYSREATRLARLVTTLSLTGTTPAVQSSAALIA
jgi:hypothetical protein